ncbi:MAG: NAD-dependent epimerase/dehydratase family protein, partial [Methylophaga sp.]|nr:NAD-dependent epimerase/dehydratase family protein [Methylophaga sp.]
MATYLLTGGTGLIGRAISKKLLGKGHEVIILSRDINKVGRLFGDKVTAVDDLQQISDGQQIDFVINLAGAPIADKRWSEKQKRILRDSRIVL